MFAEGSYDDNNSQGGASDQYEEEEGSGAQRPACLSMTLACM